MRTKLLMLLSSLLTVFIYLSCASEFISEKEEGPEIVLDQDTYQENKRSIHNDSVSIKFSEEVKIFSENQLHHFERVESDTVLYFSKGIGANQIMSVGDIYVLNESTKAFPFGFVGRVSRVTENGNSYCVTTTFVPMDSVFSELHFSTISDISEFGVYDEYGTPLEVEYGTEEYVDSLYEYTSTGDDIDDPAGHMPQRQMPTSKNAEFRYYKTVTRKLKFVDTDNFKMTGSVTAGGGITAEVDLSENYASLKAELNLKINGKMEGTLGKSLNYDNTKVFVGKIRIQPIKTLPLITVPVAFYQYTTMDANVSLNGGFEIGLSPSCSVEYFNGELSGKASLGMKKNSLFTSDISISGKLGMGIGVRSYIGLGLYKWDLINSKDGSYLDAHADAVASDKIELINNTEGFSEWAKKGYEALKDINIELSAEGGLYFENKIFHRIFGKKIKDDVLFKKTAKFTIASLYLLPEVSSLAVDVNNNSAKVKYVLSRALLWPIEYGATLYIFDEPKDQLIKTKYASEKYWVKRTEDSFDFSSLVSGYYTVYPIFKLFGLEFKCPDGFTFSILQACPDNNHPHAIDLGLPSGTKWACCNVDAKHPQNQSPTNKGGNFAWGETEECEDSFDWDTYNWSNYKWSAGDSNTLTKYCTNSSVGYNGFTDGLTELLPEDDAATVNWGAPWRIPTAVQQKELIDNCTREWTQLNGVNGALVTGPNGGTIFLPSNGGTVYIGDDEWENGDEYWSSTCSPEYPMYASYFRFDFKEWGLYGEWRSYPFPVRPVCP